MIGVGLTNDDFLVVSKRNGQVTTEEIDYLHQLHQLKPRECLSEPGEQRSPRPSMVIDDFLYQGDYNHASDSQVLRELDIRHILSICDFPLAKDMFDNYNVLWIKVDDMPHAKIRQHFDQTNEFLHVCSSKNERVLVHCQVGVSRSSSIVLAYLLKYQYGTLLEAYSHLVQRRPIALPNKGFFLQLIRYENDLRTNKTAETQRSGNRVDNVYECPV